MDRSNSVPTAVTFIIVVALCIGAFFIIKNAVNEDQEKAQVNASKEIGNLPNIVVGIDGKRYTAVTEVSYASENFIKNTPVSIEMTDEDGNHKYGCTYFKFTGEAARTNTIKKGDILIYGDSCIVIATKDFNSSGKYKKVAHINDMNGFPVGNFRVSFTSTR